MGESVNGIRGAFYSDIIYDYQCKYDDKREKSFLYRAFWAEGVSGLLKRLDRSLSEPLAGDGHESPNPHGPVLPQQPARELGLPLASGEAAPKARGRVPHQRAACGGHGGASGLG